MTTDEIKQTITMREVLDRYGIKVKNNMCCCPIHGEKHPSMKVFKDGYKCFACGSGGDVFKFVQEYEHCDFKTAFILLGGTYEKHETERARVNARAKIDRKHRVKQMQENSKKEFRKMLLMSIQICQFWTEYAEPLSDDWVYGQQQLPWLWHIYETKIINGEEVNETDVFRAYRQIEKRFTAV